MWKVTPHRGAGDSQVVRAPCSIWAAKYLQGIHSAPREGRLMGNQAILHGRSPSPLVFFFFPPRDMVVLWLMRDHRETYLKIAQYMFEIQTVKSWVAEPELQPPPQGWHQNNNNNNNNLQLWKNSNLSPAHTFFSSVWCHWSEISKEHTMGTHFIISQPVRRVS